MACNSGSWFWPDPIGFPNTLLELVKLNQARLIFKKAERKEEKENGKV
jgi:hypothetical protein